MTTTTSQPLSKKMASSHQSSFLKILPTTVVITAFFFGSSLWTTKSAFFVTARTTNQDVMSTELIDFNDFSSMIPEVDNLPPMVTIDAYSNMTDEDPVTARSSHRKGRFWFPLVTVARFPNNMCEVRDAGASSGKGTCLPWRECSERGGKVIGTCARGYGSCCLFNQQCGKIADTNNTYFVNPDYPEPFSQAGNCRLAVKMISKNICQLRVHFHEFLLTGPSLAAASAGQCKADRLMISGTRGEPPPQICGMNHGQHMYLDVNRDRAPVLFDIMTYGAQIKRKWKIEISQIPCGEYVAPSGCLQYFTSLLGSVKSFNFDGNIHLANQRYSICVRMEPGFCTIEWSPAMDENERMVEHAFSISDTQPSMEKMIAGTEFADPRRRIPGGKPVWATCTGAPGYSDYVSIPCGSPDGDRVFTLLGPTGGDQVSCAHKFCGQALNHLNGANGSVPVTSSVKPFQIEVHFDGSESEDGGDGGLPNRGFHLRWTQKPCQG